MKGIQMLRGASALILVLVITACGGETAGGGESCVWPGACGGDITGTWNLRSACVLGTPSDASCPSLRISVQTVVSGTLTFVADGTYTANVNESAFETATFPASCLDGVTECSSLGADLRATLPDTASVGCTGTPATSCTCTITATFTDPLRDGTYTLSGNAITMNTDDGKTLPKRFCVKGSRLTLANDNGDDGTQSIVVGIRQ